MKNALNFCLFAAAWLCLESLLVAFADRPVADFTRELDVTHRGLIDLFRTTTDFAKSAWYLWPAGFAILALAAWLRAGHATPAARRRIAVIGHGLVFLFAAIALSGIATDLLKPILGRARPIEMARDGLYGFYPFSFQAAMNSMPSGHATTAAALAAVLCLLLPRGRIVWIFIGVFLAVSRIMVNAHYLADIVAGGLVGVLTTLALARRRDRQGMFPWMRGIFPIDSPPAPP